MVKTMVKAIMGNVVLRAGLAYGLVGGVICLLITAASVTHLSRAPLGLLHPLVGLALLALFVYYFLLVYVFAGRWAAGRTGRVGDGALTGLITGVVTSVFACIAVMGQSILAPDTVRQIGPLIAPAPGDVLAAVACALVNALSTFATLAAFAGLGALGGLAGRKAYRKAYREARRSAPPWRGGPGHAAVDA